MKIVQFGLHYSPNVGDGIISETLGNAIQTRRADAQFETIDISGRSGFGDVVVGNRLLLLRLLGMMPPGLRGRLVEARLTRMLNRVAPDWLAALEGADLAVIGGGQIFSDADLNFCTKIAHVSDLLRRTGVPAVIHAAGVSGNWSSRGTQLFETVFDTDLRGIGLRDGLSIEHWKAQTAARPAAGRQKPRPMPNLVRDPGLLAAACYGPAPERREQIALCITAPKLLSYHSDTAVVGAGTEGLGYFIALTSVLAGRGHRVMLFCNGAAEDRAAVGDVASAPEIQALIAHGQVAVASPPETPTELAQLIRPCQAVIAHRMHACIVAYSYQIPTVGLGWDRKLDSFFASIDASDWFVGQAQATPETVADRAEAAIATGVARDTHDRVTAETWAAIDQLLSRI